MTSPATSPATSPLTSPLIGLTTYRDQARWGVWDASADLVPTTYTRAIQDAGGVPVLLPPTQPYEDAAEAAVARIDALLLIGGADVSPERYGAEPHQTSAWREERDAWELALLWAVDAVRRPVLGVCRGMQLMAVHAGGALDQHVPDLVGHERHSPGGDLFGETAVKVQPGSKLADLLPPELTVHCHHHQSVRTHPGFVASAWADDGLLEAMEAPGSRWCVAVQWHPEMAKDAGLFRGLVAAARG